MLISDIIARIDALKPNKYSSAIKLGWINHVDGLVWNEIYKHTSFSDVARQAGVSAYNLPEGVDFNLVTAVYINGKPIYPITYKDFETTGYFRGTDGKLNIYPVPTTSDTSPGLRIVYRIPFTPHSATSEQAYMHAPYDKAYDDYIAAMIDKYNQDMDGYNNNTAFFNNSMKEYAEWYFNQRQEE